MKEHTFILYAVAIVASAAFTTITAINWQVKEDSYSIKFDTKGASGIMKGLKGTINFDINNLPQSNFDVTVDVNTINTGNGVKNKHAKGEGFFDAGKYPVIRFTSSKIEKTSEGFLTTGRLKIKDVTKEISIPFTFKGSEREGIFTGNFEIDRKEYNLNRGGVGEIVKIELVIPVKN